VPPANRQSGPGAFGQQAGSPAQQQRNTSAMSRDVDQSAARERALGTLDQRRAAANAPQPLPPLNDALRQPPQPPQRPGPAYGAPPYAGPSPVYAPPAQQSNGLMAGVLGFMLGRAMSQSNQPVAYPTTHGNPPAPAATVPTDAAAATGAAATAGSDGTGLVGGMPGLDAPAPAAVPAPPPAPSFMARVLRLFAWLSVVSLLFWAVVYSVRKFRRLRAAPNYSFERN
jgi:hypothetical protein